MSSNLSHLKAAYQRHPALAQVVKSLENQAIVPRIKVKGLRGAQESFVLAAAYDQVKNAEGKKCHHLFIASGKEEAAYRHNDLSAILGEDVALFFPDSFKRPAYFDDLNPTLILQRGEVVNQLSQHQGQKIIVTYPEALFEKVVAPKVLDESRINIKQNEELDTDFMIEVLVEYGFERADFVYEPGQFSIRGGIIDLFSYGNEWPYRIELFDTTVESIREFEPLTQLSKRTLTQVSIVPNLNTRFRQDQKVSLFQVLQADTVIWMRDYQLLLDQLQTCFERAELFASKITAFDDVSLRDLFRDRAFVYPNQVTEEVESRALVFLE